MKKLSLISYFLSLVSVAHAQRNPFFGDANNQVFLYFGAGVNDGLGFPAPIIPAPNKWVPFGMINIDYAQPNTFFRLPGRLNISYLQTEGWGTGYGWNWRDLQTSIVTLSQDIALFWGHGFYGGIGAGAGFQRFENYRVSSKLLFQFKTFIGYEITDRWRAEIFTHHLSNGSTTAVNYSYNFYGIGFGYNF